MRSPLIANIVAAVVGAILIASPSSSGTPRSPDWTPETLPWQSVGANGTRYALLEGDRDTAGGVFTYAFFIPAGVWDSPHWHSTTARVVVLKGALRLGYGNVADRSKAATFGPGTVIVVPGGARHFDGADVDTVIVGIATGRWATTYLDGSKPASAGTPRSSSDQRR